MKSFFFYFVVALLPVSVFADEPLQQRLQPTVSKALRFLEDDMVRWREKRNCSACHHGPMYVWSLNLARERGFAVNEPQLREMTEWLLTSEESRVFPKAETLAALASSSKEADRVTAQMMGQQNFSQPTIYLAHALNAMPANEPLRKLGWQKLTAHFAASQSEDGSFVGTVGRPPIFNSPRILTLWAETGMRGANWEPASKSLSRATAWLAKQPPDESHQGIVLRLPRASQGDRPRLLERLRELQRADGGWSQTADLPADAFATGQSLSALRAVGVSASDPAVQRGIEFLMRTQRDDGTWPMISRPHPETGRPASNLNPITYAATAWGVIGLVSHTER